MYTDHAPCAVCGAPVRLTPRTPTPDGGVDGAPVGPPDGVVGTGDPTVDRRRCTNDDCVTRDPASDLEP